MNEGLRIGDAERDLAAADLSEHVALGRLSVEEHAERLDAVWSARTGADLAVVFHDLPPAPATPSHVRPGPGRRPGPGPRGSRPFRGPGGPPPLVPVAIVLVALSVVTHLPLWIGILLLACGLRLGRRRGPARA